MELETTDPGGHLKPLGWCNKIVEGNAIVKIVVRFETTHMQFRLKESKLSCTCQKNRTKVTRTGNWKIYVIKSEN